MQNYNEPSILVATKLSLPVYLELTKGQVYMFGTLVALQPIELCIKLSYFPSTAPRMIILAAGLLIQLRNIMFQQKNWSATPLPELLNSMLTKQNA